tara:strand:+ start:66 stop:734 length:669 start_codon:yes stop_codon:yes gene_type:complete
MYLAPQMRLAALGQQGRNPIGRGQFSASGEPNTPEFNALKAKRAELQEQMKTIPRSIRGGSNEFGQNPMPAITSFGPKYNPTQQETDGLARYKSILSQQKEIDSQISSMMPNQGIILEPPTRPGGMENLSGSLGGQRPSPYSAPQMPQMGGGFGGNQGMQQFMQFMQTMMQMFQQFQGGGGRGMGGGFQGPSPFRPQQQQYGQYQPRRMSNQFNSNNAFGGY